MSDGGLDLVLAPNPLALRLQPEVVVGFAAGPMHRSVVQSVVAMITPGEPVVTLRNGLDAAVRQERLRQDEADAILTVSHLLGGVQPSEDGTQPPGFDEVIRQVTETANRIFADPDASALATGLASLARDNLNPPPGTPGHRDYKWWHVDLFVLAITADPLAAGVGSALSAL
jgi:hypothetical protein